jgi:hypothetical protein
MGGLHADTGDELVLLKLDVPDQSKVPTARKWANVITPLGGRGYVSQVDPRDLENGSNLSNVTAPSPDVGISFETGVDMTANYPVPPGAYPETMGMPAEMKGWPPGYGYGYGAYDPRFAWDPRFGPPPPPWLRGVGGAGIVGASAHGWYPYNHPARAMMAPQPPAMARPPQTARNQAEMFARPNRPAGIAYRPRG